MPVIKRLVRSFRRLRLFKCGFLRGKPLLCMHLQLPRSCRILISPGDRLFPGHSITLKQHVTEYWVESNLFKCTPQINSTLVRLFAQKVYDIAENGRHAAGHILSTTCQYLPQIFWQYGY